MLLRNSKDYKLYFQKFKDFEGIKTVGFGDYDRFVAKIKDPTFKYPTLWVERPEIAKVEFGGSKKRFNGGIAILMNTSKATTDDQEDDILTDCEELLFKVLHEMEADANEYSFEFDDSPIDTQFKDRTSGDMAIGSRAEIKLIGGYDYES
jgi:hypothetical protein